LQKINLIKNKLILLVFGFGVISLIFSLSYYLYDKNSNDNVLGEYIKTEEKVKKIQTFSVFTTDPFMKTNVNTIEIEIISNEEIKNIDFLPDDAELNLISNINGKFKYNLKLSNIPVGDSAFHFEVTSITNARESFAVFISKTGFDPETKEWLDGNDLLAVIDKQYHLSSNYAPNDLVSLENYGIVCTLSNQQLRKEPAEKLSEMINDAKKLGYDLKILSAYRSYETQKSTYAYWLKTVGKTQADRASAQPGHSEHQLGTTVDLTSIEIDNKLSTNFKYVNAGKWVAENAHKYGFVMTYTEGS